MLPVEAQATVDEILGGGKFAPGYERTYWPGCVHGFAVRGDMVSADSVTIPRAYRVLGTERPKGQGRLRGRVQSYRRVLQEVPLKQARTGHINECNNTSRLLGIQQRSMIQRSRARLRSP